MLCAFLDRLHILILNVKESATFFATACNQWPAKPTIVLSSICKQLSSSAPPLGFYSFLDRHYWLSKGGSTTTSPPTYVIISTGYLPITGLTSSYVHSCTSACIARHQYTSQICVLSFLPTRLAASRGQRRAVTSSFLAHGQLCTALAVSLSVVQRPGTPYLLTSVIRYSL